MKKEGEEAKRGTRENVILKMEPTSFFFFTFRFTESLLSLASLFRLTFRLTFSPRPPAGVL